MCRMGLSHYLTWDFKHYHRNNEAKTSITLRAPPSLFTFPSVKVKIYEMPEVCSSQLSVATSLKQF